MKTFLSFLFLSSFSLLMAQRPVADVVKTKGGELSIQPLMHATMALTWKGKTIYVDPYGGGKLFEGIAAPDLVLITDIHPDHYNAETLGALDLSKATLIVPQAVADQLSENLKSKAVVVKNAETIEKLGISITGVPMYNLPEAADAKHTKGRGNGYVLKFDDKSVYISGDTSGVPEMRALKNIDIAFVCMNLPYTMTVEEAASAVLDFKPKIVYAFHYRGQNGLSDTEAFKKLVNDKDKNIEVRLRNWYWFSH